ncbi:MAG: glycosyl hydrolase [Acidobacteriaceae bacterium]
MSISRRSFLASSSALLATTAASRAFAKSTRPLNPKKGLGGAAPLASGLVTSWYYDWGIRPAHRGIPAANPSMRFLPMIWGWNPNRTPAVLNMLRAEHPSILLGFNEPDHKDQSNIPVKVALGAWPQFEGIATELVSPAAANAHGPWMQEFMNGVHKRKLRVDSIAYHAYPGPNPEGFLHGLYTLHQMYELPIWVTEFAVADWQAKHGAVNRYTVRQTAEFMKTVCTEMDKLPWVKGYAWFPAAGDKKEVAAGSRALATSVLFDASGNLTPLGELYASL